MSTRKSIIPLLLIFLFSWTGCEVPFSPKGQYVDKLVVYCLLDPTRPLQFARVYTTYNVEGSNPNTNVIDTQVPNASVQVIDDQGRAYVFRDSVFKRESLERYSSDIIVYYSDQLKPVSGRRYKIEVNTPRFGKANSEVTIPEPYIVFVNGSRSRALLADSANICRCFQISVFGGRGAKGHLTRFFVNYTVKKPGKELSTLRWEVPIGSRRSVDGSKVSIYPQPDRAPFLEFTHELYFDALTQIQQSDPSADIDIRDVTFVTHALDPSLYNYYQLTHGFGDPFSVRLDQPDFSNIENGFGVFGALTVDSLTLSIR